MREGKTDGAIHNKTNMYLYFWDEFFYVDECMNLPASCFLASTSFDDNFKGDVSEKDEDSKMSQISEHKTGL